VCLRLSSDECSSVAVVRKLIACHELFACHVWSMCRESCEALADIFCETEWNLLTEGGSSDVLPACHSLPSALNVSAPACFHVDLFAVSPDKISGSSVALFIVTDRLCLR